MKVIGIDGREYIWKIKSKPRSTASKPHVRCRELLKEIYPLDQILEEVYLPGANKLYLDFYLPLRNLAVEVDGNQHKEYIPHFHKSKLAYYKSLKRDGKKAEWCNINKIKLISLLAEESIDEWRKRITE